MFGKLTKCRAMNPKAIPQLHGMTSDEFSNSSYLNNLVVNYIIYYHIIKNKLLNNHKKNENNNLLTLEGGVALKINRTRNT